MANRIREYKKARERMESSLDTLLYRAIDYRGIDGGFATRHLLQAAREYAAAVATLEHMRGRR